MADETKKVTGIKVESKHIDVPFPANNETKPKRERIEDILLELKQEISQLNNTVSDLMKRDESQKTLYIFDLQKIYSSEIKSHILKWISNMGGMYERLTIVNYAMLSTSTVFNVGDIIYIDDSVKVTVEKRIVNYKHQHNIVIELKLVMDFK